MSERFLIKLGAKRSAFRLLNISSLLSKTQEEFFYSHTFKERQ